MVKKLLGGGITIATAVLLYIVFKTTPTEAGPLGILMVFFCLYVIVVSITTAALYGGSGLLSKFSRAASAKRPLEQMSAERSYYFATVVSFAPIILIAMQSVGKIALYEFLLVVAFVVVGCLYVSKRTTQRS